MEQQTLLGFFLALLAIANPLGKVPLWIAASRRDGERVRSWLVLLIVATGAGVLLLFLLAGRQVLGLFGIDLNSFLIGGGIVILILGIRMLEGNAVDLDLDEAEEAPDSLTQARWRYRQVVIPLAVPFIAGPGSITTVILYGARADSTGQALAMVGILLVVMGIIGSTLKLGHRIRRLVGDTPLEVQTRLFGLILTAIAAQLIVEGLGLAFPAWLADANAPVESPIEEEVARDARASGA